MENCNGALCWTRRLAEADSDLHRRSNRKDRARRGGCIRPRDHRGICQVAIDPPASSYAIMQRASPYCGENPGPGKDVHGELDPTARMFTESLTPRPELENSQGQLRQIDRLPILRHVRFAPIAS